MKFLDLTLATPGENLACDEALLDWCEAGHEPEGLLRFWQAEQFFAVVGYGNEISREVNVAAARERGIPILRRCSGGGTVLQGPGCLNYALVLKIEGFVEGITETNRFVMERNASALGGLVGDGVSVQGFTDLALGDLKFSGNSQRRRREFLLFHGTFLFSLHLELMEELLSCPSREPAYRRGRSHASFLTSLALAPEEVKTALRDAWRAQEALREWPEQATAQLALGKYSTPDWNVKKIAP